MSARCLLAWIGAILVCLGNGAVAASSALPDLSEYDVYYGDMDSEEHGQDGYADVLLRGRPGYTLITGNASFPVSVPSDLPDLLYCGSASGEFTPCSLKEGAGVPEQPTDAFNVVLQDWDGDGVPDLLLQAQDPNTRSLVIKMKSNGQFSLARQFTAIGGSRVSGLSTLEREQKEDVARSISQSVGASALASSNQSAQALTGDIVGAVPDSVDVVQGQLHYSIPISLPKGPGGIDPSFSIGYSSDAGYGVLGIGSRLSFQSYIERCPRTRLRDGAAFALASGTDRLCLDGVRLVLASGKHWHNGAVYYPELESGIKVVYERASGTEYHQGTFKVYTAEGDVRSYGENPETRIAGGAPVNGATSRWALSQVANRQGYGYTIRYVAEHGAAFPQWLYYTHDGEHLGQSVRFAYDEDNYAPTQYVVGKAYGAGRRLTGISAIHNHKTVRVWQFAYQVNSTTRRALLHQFQECGADLRCVSPTTLTWEKGARSIGHGSVHSELSGNARTLRRWWLDINRDGARDLCAIYDTGPQAHFKCHLSNGQGGFDGALAIKEAIPARGWNLDPYWNDVDKDGYPDFCHTKTWGISETTDRVYCYRNQTGRGFVAQWQDDLARPVGSISHRHWTDITGNGLPDYCYGHQYPDSQHRMRPRISCKIATLEDGALVYSAGHTAVFSAGHDTALEGRWIDLNNDMVQDYCHFTWKGAQTGRIQCHRSGASRIDPNLFPWDAQSTWLTDPKATLGRQGQRLKGDPTGFESRFFDMNGDGYRDYCRIYREGDKNSRQFRARCLMNTGSGWGQDLVSPTMTLRGPSLGLSFVDVNQDGYVDWCALSEGMLQCQLNRGGAFSASTSLIQMDTMASTASELAWVDVTGDGIANLCLTNEAGVTCYPTPLVGPQDRLVEIRNGLEVTTSVTYSGLDDPAVYDYRVGTAQDGLRDLPSGLRIVSRLQRDDGVGGHLTTNYYYEDYGYYPDERGVVGFRYIRSRLDSAEPGVIQQESWYNQRIANLQAGRLYQRVTTYNDEFVLTERTNWETLIYEAGQGNGYRVVPNVQSIYNEQLHPLRYAVRPTYTSQTLAMEGGSTQFLKLTEDFEYDVYGNNLRATQTVQRIGSGDAHTRETVNTFENDVTRWLMGKRTRSEVTSRSPGAPPLTRTTTWDYFKSGPGEGQVKSQVSDPDQATRTHTATYTYNVFGLLQSVIETPAGEEARSQTYRYDADGRFLIEEQNALGHTSQYAYDPLSGLPTRETDPNGLTTVWEYDPLGRLIREIEADGTRVDVSYAACLVDCPVRAAYVVTRQVADINGNAMMGAVSTYRDTLGREIERRWGGFGGETLVERRSYDALGRLKYQSEPYEKGEAARGYSVVRRDGLGRPTLEGLSSGLRISTDYEGLTTRQTISGSITPRVRTSVKDAIGRLTSVTDAEGGLTRYDYDAAGRMIRTQLPNGTVMTQVYDQGGRKIRSEDPNTGTWRYAYNGADQLVLQENGNGARTCHVYDVLGRQVRQVDDYLPDQDWATAAASAQNGCAGQPPTTTWAYDIAEGGVGRLAAVSHGSTYWETLTYDSVGRPKTTTVRAEGVTYTRDLFYDGVTGRLIQETPLHRSSGPKVTVSYRYNNQGYLTALGPAEEPDYTYWTIKKQNANGQVTERQIAGGLLREQAEFGPDSGRMTSLEIFRVVDSESVYCETASYDVKGRMKRNERSMLCGLTEAERQQRLAELVAELPEDATTEERLLVLHQFLAEAGQAVSKYQYDLLDRLTSETVTLPATSMAELEEGLSEEWTARYDAEGNIAERSGMGVYYYGEPCEVDSKRYTPGPHALTRIVGAAGTDQATTTHYCYDGAGNMIAGAGKRITYSNFNKPVTIKEGDTTIRFQYGPDRERLKTVTQVDSQGVSKTVTQRRLDTYEHLLILENGNATEQERLHLPGGVVLTLNGGGTPPDEQYLFTDTLGSVTAVANKLGGVDVGYRYDPWGRPRDNRSQALNESQWRGLDRLEKGTGTGFTGHSMLDEVGLIHMGGRLYDPNAGRFLSADPFIEDLTNAQTYNRYSYVRNSPTNLTDPSGYRECHGDIQACQFEDQEPYLIPGITVCGTPGGCGRSAPPPSGPGPVGGELGYSPAMGGLRLGPVAPLSSMGGGAPVTRQIVSTPMTNGCGAGCGVDNWAHALYAGLLPNIANVTDNMNQLPAQTTMGSLSGAAVALGNVFVDLRNATTGGLLAATLGWPMGRDIASIVHVDGFEIPQEGAYAAASVEGVGMVFAATKVARAESLVRVTQRTGPYKQVKGHHVHAKAAFKENMAYDPNQGFSISQAFMKEHGLDHAAMTRYQRQAFKELAQSGGGNTMRAHTRIAVEALQAGGASRSMARSLAAQSLNALRNSGVRVPSNIPWYR
ncbi:RHS repeat-associated core domain-containing protein [Alloalcanivorax xenomutans]|uniref:RHS repeat-associated core domain-containing protein n=1 Tax=Alloalcanivorax xenomutans TaxID=1094342 RepID=UPI003D9B00B9